MNNPVIVGLGELLWDVYDDAALLGGAPANFAAHASALGMRGVIKSAVGDDDLGHQALEWLQAHGLTADYMDIDPKHPTGTVRVQLDSQGHPTYVFASDVAWDHLGCDELDRQLASACDAVCFGTLAQRSPDSRAAIRSFLDSVPEASVRVLDVNLRQNFFSDTILHDSMERATFVKMNDEEWPVVCRALGISEAPLSSGVESLAKRFELDGIAVTRGRRGSLLWWRGEWDEQVPEPIDPVDTVGAGDAFTAALIAGILRNESVSQLHHRASRIAAYVCTQRGATPKLPAEFLY